MKYIYVASSTNLLIKKSIVSVAVFNNDNNDRYTVDDIIKAINKLLNSKLNGVLTLNQHPFYMIDCLYLWKVTEDITVNSIHDNIFKNIKSKCDIYHYANKNSVNIHNIHFKDTPFYNILLDISETIEINLPVKNVGNVGDNLIYRHIDDIKINTNNFNQNEFKNTYKRNYMSINDKNENENENYTHNDNNIIDLYIKERIEILRYSHDTLGKDKVDEVYKGISRDEDYIRIAKNEWKVMSDNQRESIRKRFKNV